VRDERGEQIAELDRARIDDLLASGVATGGMRPKLRACLEALGAGVGKILIIGAAQEDSLLKALRSGEALGTRIDSKGRILKMPEYLFVCGTLRSGLAPDEVAGLMGGMRRIGAASAPGRLYDLGDYPGAVLDPECNTKIIGEVFQLSDDGAALAALDAYEGIDPKNPGDSLFVRREAEITLEGGANLQCWIYVYNRQVASATLITSGDYLIYKQERRG